VIRNLAKQFGWSVNFIETPSVTFSYFDENTYTADEALDVLNDHLLQEGFIIIRDAKNISVISATDQIPDSLIPFVSIHDIRNLGRNELASVAFPSRNTDPALAVQEMKQLVSPLGQVKPLTNSGRIIITDTGNYLRRMGDLLLGRGIGGKLTESVVHPLSHASAEEVANSINQFLTGQSAQSAGIGGDESVPGGNRVVAEPTTNSLLIRGTPEEIAAVTSLILELDRGPREVLVQAVLVEVQLENTHEFGVELGFQDSVLFNRSVIDNLVTITETTTNPLGVATTNQRIVSQTAAPGFNFNNQPLGNNTAISPSTIGSQGLSGFGVGRVNGDLGFGGLVLSAGSDSVNVLLRALDANFDIDILSRPQIRTVENHEALIQIGQQVPVVDGVSITAVGSANPVIRQEQAGIILRVIPRISPSGRIIVAVDAEKSAFRLTPGTGVPIFTDATNGNVIEAPVKDITTANTTVSVQSGQTIVLGGMITEVNRTTNRKVPWLGDLPVIGRAFRYDLNNTARTELLVLLTPIQISDDGHAERLKHQEVARIRMPPSTWAFRDNVYGTSEFQIRSGMQQLFQPPELTEDLNGPTVEQAQHGTQMMTATPNFAPAGGHVTPIGAQQRLSSPYTSSFVKPAVYSTGDLLQDIPAGGEVGRGVSRRWQQRPTYRGHFDGQWPTIRAE
jgi:type II secretory pathway component GspD/PulD (secretin)